MKNRVIKAYIVVHIDDDDLENTHDDAIEFIKQGKFKISREYGNEAVITVDMTKKDK